MIELDGNKNILILRLGKIGDIIIASSAFSAWKKLFPENQLILVTLYKNKEVLKYNYDLNKIYYIKNKPLIFLQLFRLRKIKFDLLLDLNDDPSTTSIMIRKFIKSKSTAGFKFDDKNNLDIFLEQPSKKETHIIERLSQLIQKINPIFRNLNLRPVLYLGKKEASDVNIELLQNVNHKKIIAINLSAGAPIRYWPEKKWVSLINLICKESDMWNFILLSEKRDRKTRDNIFEQVDKSRVVITRYNSFHHYAAFIKNSDLVITADTAAVHISSAFNIPVVAIYPNYQWNFISWQPLSDNFRAIRSLQNNISDVSVDTVYESFLNLVNELQVNINGK
jgi:ADP-heptose:LPS heptosyltransferase